MTLAWIIGVSAVASSSACGARFEERFRHCAIDAISLFYSNDTLRQPSFFSLSRRAGCIRSKPPDKLNFSIAEA
jgi:hypothetical protein